MDRVKNYRVKTHDRPIQEDICASCCKNIPPNKCISSYLISEGKVTVYDAIQQILNYANYNNQRHQRSHDIPMPKFCLNCGQLFGALLTAFKDFEGVCAPHSYIKNLNRTKPTTKTVTALENEVYPELKCEIKEVADEEMEFERNSTPCIVTVVGAHAAKEGGVQCGVGKASESSVRSFRVGPIILRRSNIGKNPTLKTISASTPVTTDPLSLVDNNEHPTVNENQRTTATHNSEKSLDFYPRGRKCQYCAEIFKSPVELKSHEKSHARIRACRYCSKIILTPKTLKEHESKLKCVKELPFPCFYCGKRFDTEKHRHRHHLKMHPQFERKTRTKSVRSEADSRLLKTKKYRCDEANCNIWMPTYTAWCRHHLEVHGNDLGAGDRDQPLDSQPRPCPQCGKKVTSNSGMLTHIKTKHVTKLLLKCDQCDKKYATQWYLDEHKAIMHSEEDAGLLCTHCGATFQTKAGLSYHKRAHLNQIEKSHTCDICGFKTRNRTMLRTHKLTHTDERPFPCDHCGMSYKTKRAVQDHKARQAKKHIRDSLCEVCGKSYAFTNELKGHLISAHKYDEEKARIAAGIRHKIFRILPNGDKVYDEEKLRKPKTCTICHKKYSRRESLFTHLISVHRKTEEEAKEITRFESIRQKNLVSKCLRGLGQRSSK